MEVTVSLEWYARKARQRDDTWLLWTAVLCLAMVALIGYLACGG